MHLFLNMTMEKMNELATWIANNITDDLGVILSALAIAGVIPYLFFREIIHGFKSRRRERRIHVIRNIKTWDL